MSLSFIIVNTIKTPVSSAVKIETLLLILILSSVFKNGSFIGRFIVHTSNALSIPITKFQLIGHSLGAQVSGFAGQEVFKLTDTKVSRIVGLDPAGPDFYNNPTTERLSKNDADVVVIVHTDGGVLGYFNPCGTIDFYPHGGRAIQPGCPNKLELRFVTCSHWMSIRYYTKALKGGNLFGTKCSSYGAFKRGSCKNNEKVWLGHNITSESTGSYYW